ncbi:hypothetical protein CIK05_05180 [Bdellovibrio sp. qaytius]|nr:hypothetical protein CIK05_05180 [Bdellovibrio sp. qaytius]
MEKLFSANLLKKYMIQIVAIIGVFVGVALVAAFTIKPRYKVASVVSISPSYFQNSLMREFLSEVYDPNELRSQRMSIMTAALDKDFLDQIARLDGIDISKETSTEAAERRMVTLSSIEIIPTQASDFQISVISHNRDKAMQLNQKVIENIIVVLKEKRMGMLTNLRSAVAAQIETMSPNIEVPASHEAQLARMANLEAQVADLKERFSNQHPQVVALEKQLATYKKLSSKSAATTPGSAGSVESVSNYNIKDGSTKSANYNTVYDDLIRKLRYLNIVITAESTPQPSYFSVVRSPEYPLGAIWPKKTLFLIWSLLLGILTSLIFVAVAEVAAQKLVAAKKAKANRKLDFIEEDTIQTSKTKANAENDETL